MDFYIANMGSKVKENADFFLSRQSGHPRYVFVQFLTEAVMKKDDKEIPLHPGSCLIYTPDYPEFYRPVGGPLNHDWIEFKCQDPSIFEKLKIPLNEPFMTTTSSSITNHISVMKGIFDENIYSSQIELNKYIIELFLIISKNLHSKYKNLIKSKTDDIRDIFEQIRLNIYQNPINKSIASIAKNSGYTQSYFCTAYKKIFNTTALEDLNKSRVLYVKYALENGRKTLDIAEEIGFTTLEYFYMWFKKQFGVTVNEYRNSHNND